MKRPPGEWVAVECAPGLEQVVFAEVTRCCQAGLPTNRQEIQFSPGEILFPYSGNLRNLLNLKTAYAVYLVLIFSIPRPRALLGDQNFRRLIAGIRSAFELGGRTSFQTLFISAAGSESAVMTRLKDALAVATGLAVGNHEGDLLLRLRRSGAGKAGWEMLVRLTSRPLATRPWRVCNYEGALNASVAHAMVELTRPQPQDIFLNLACGSGTLLVERLVWGPCHMAIGCDLSPLALACAKDNLDAARPHGRAMLVHADAGEMPLLSGTANVLCADLPFGSLIGSHADNLIFYPRFLRECTRLAREGARAAIITHEIKLFRSLLARSTDWQVQREIQISLSGLHPSITLMVRK